MTTIPLSSIVNVESFKAHIDRGYIQERKHPKDDNLRIYSYTRRTQFGGFWNINTKLARGLILELPNGSFEDAIVRGRGLPKFFTVEQSESDWGRAKLVDDDENVTVQEAPIIPWDLPAVVHEKVNGALGLGYIDPSGVFRISTKGSFSSLEADVSNRLLDGKYGHLKNMISDYVSDSGFTPLFEIITPERIHPVDYGDLEDLIYLGSVYNGTGKWIPAESGNPFELWGFPQVEATKFGTLREAILEPWKPNTEGFVVTILNGGPEDIYKIKPKEYTSLRWLFYLLQDGDIRGYLSTLKPEELAANADDFSLRALAGDLELNEQMIALIEKRSTEVREKYILPTQDLVDRTVKAIAEWKSANPEADRSDAAKFVQTHVQDKQLHGVYYAACSMVSGDLDDRIYSRALKYVVDTV